MPDRDVLLVQHLLRLLLLLHGVVHLHLPRLPPPRLVLCVVANGGKEKGEGEADQQVSSEVCPGGEGEGGEGEAGSSILGPVSHQGGSYQAVHRPTTTRH